MPFDVFMKKNIYNFFCIIIFILLSLIVNRKICYFDINTLFFIFLTLIILYNYCFSNLSEISWRYIFLDISIYSILFFLPININLNNNLGIKKYIIFFACFLIIIIKLLLLIFKIQKKTKTISNHRIYFIIFFLLFPMIVWQNNFRYYGDEPYYLLITHSIIYDFDVDLKNNYENSDSRLFYDYYLKPQPSYHKNNKIYSSHFIGLPILLSPFYFLLKKEGIILFFSITSSLFIYLFYNLLKLFFNNNNKTFIITILLLFTAPYLEMFSSIYPEIPAGCIFLILFYDLSKEKNNYLKHSFLFFLLSLLGIKYLPSAFILWAILSLNYYKKKEINIIIKFNSALIIGAFLLILFYYYVYGEFKPFGIAFSHSADSNKFIFQNFISQLYELTLGQRYGIFFCAPIYMFIFFALYKYIKKFPYPILIFISQFIPFCLFSELPGDSPPVRYFISTLMFLTFYLFCLIYNNFDNKKVIKYLFLLIYFFNMIYSIFYLVLPYYRNKSTGQNNLIYFINTKINFLND